MLTGLPVQACDDQADSSHEQHQLIHAAVSKVSELTKVKAYQVVDEHTVALATCST